MGVLVASFATLLFPSYRATLTLLSLVFTVFCLSSSHLARPDHEKSAGTLCHQHTCNNLVSCALFVPCLLYRPSSQLVASRTLGVPSALLGFEKHAKLDKDCFEMGRGHVVIKTVKCNFLHRRDESVYQLRRDASYRSSS